MPWFCRSFKFTFICFSPTWVHCCTSLLHSVYHMYTLQIPSHVPKEDVYFDWLNGFLCRQFVISFTSFRHNTSRVHPFVETRVIGPFQQAIYVYWFSDCGSPTPLSGSSNNNATTFNSTVTITCDSGYSINGKSVTTCQSDGTWTSLPTCDPSGTLSRFAFRARNISLHASTGGLNEGGNLY
jgi:Sushi repeat (SCR repeat)